MIPTVSSPLNEDEVEVETLVVVVFQGCDEIEEVGAASRGSWSSEYDINLFWASRVIYVFVLYCVCIYILKTTTPRNVWN